MSATVRRDHIREMLADLKLPGALEAVDDIQVDLFKEFRHGSVLQL